ncbi:MAG: proton-translocating transhydrogenase family protein [Polyangiaceae bacterium]
MHTAHERHQRDQRHHPRRRHAAALGQAASSPHVVLGALAVLLATINVAGGFLVTQRMLRMFRR